MRTPVTLHETLDGYFEVVPRPAPDELTAYYRAFRRGCAHAGLGRNLIAYVRPGDPA